MKKFRFISLLLLAAMVAGTLSCGEPAANGNEDDTSTEPDATETTEPAYLSPVQSISDEELEALGLEGYDFRVFMRVADNTWSNKDIIAETEYGEQLNDAVYRRNLQLEETYGFTISADYSADLWGKEIGTYILADDDTYDAAFPMARVAASIAQEGSLVDFKTLKYVDLDSEVWNKTFNDTLTYNGKLFYATGDFSINAIESVRGFMFNKDIAKDHQLGDLYELARSGKWTLDKFEEMCTIVARDINTDQKMDENDLWGYSGQKNTSGQPFYYGTGELLVRMEDGLPVVEVGSERSTIVFERIRSLLTNNSICTLLGDNECREVFTNGNALFFAEVMTMTNQMRDTEVDFGLLPAPKFDENQENYCTFADSWCISPATIPVTAKDPERSGFVLQAMAEISREMVRPVYYDICLTGRNLRDDESAEMLDLIFENFVLDNMDIFQWADFFNTLREGFTGNKELASIVDSKIKALNTEIGRTTQAFEKLG